MFLTQANRKVSVGGEEQLLAVYLKNINSRGEHDIVFAREIPSEVDFVHLTGGILEDVRDSPRLAAKLQADRISYFWESLIERFVERSDPSLVDLGFSRKEEGLEIACRAMAAESRVERRHLSKVMIDTRAHSSPSKSYVRVVTPSSGKTAYVFLFEPVRTNESYEVYRKYRVSRLFAYCHVAVLRAPSATQVIGIATESINEGNTESSEDLIYLEAVSDRDRLVSQARDIQKQFGLILDENVEKSQYREVEYPEIDGGDREDHKPDAEQRRSNSEWNTGHVLKRQTVA